jgi:hypothetical protein
MPCVALQGGEWMGRVKGLEVQKANGSMDDKGLFAAAHQLLIEISYEHALVWYVNSLI